MALSTYLPLSETLAAEASTVNQDIPIMMAHGSEDPIVPLILAERTRTHLQEQGYEVEWHSYAMPHAVCDQEIVDISAWLLRSLVPTL